MKRQLLITFFLLGIVLVSNAQISGTVFRDYNGNGVKNNTATFNEPFVQGVSVKAFNSANVQLGTTKTTSAVGAYSFTVGEIPAGTAVRIEFSGLGVGDFSSANGVGNGTNVQFVTAPNAATNFALNAPDDYWDNTALPNPSLMVVHQRRGAINNPSYEGQYSLLQISNNAVGPNAPVSATSVTTDTSVRTARFSQTGSVYGLAYQTNQERYFTASYTKRMSGFGPQGSGGVYIMNKSGSNWVYGGAFTLQGVTPSNGGAALDFGSVTRTTAPGTAAAQQNYLPVNTSTWTYQNPPGTYLGSDGRDNDAFLKVGTTSYGDIDFAKSDDQLYLINMNQGRLVILNASGTTASLNGASAATLAPLTTAYTLSSLPGYPAPVGAGNQMRPFAVKLYKGMGYIGVVSDASATQAVADLRGYVLQFNPQNIAAGFTTVLTINFNQFEIGYGYNEFRPWVTNWAQTGGTSSFGNTSWSQPMISDIEFNEDGSMDIAIRDRWGDQGASFEFWPVASPVANAAHHQTVTQGDLLHACFVSGAWILEGTAGSCTQPNVQGAIPGSAVGDFRSFGNTGSEWYGDIAGDGNSENILGGLSKLMGSGNIASSCLDPIVNGATPGSNYWSTSGVQWNNVSTGIKSQIVRTVGSDYGGMDKANSLGDIEFMNQFSPIQVGNRIWYDTNGNGIQDAGENTTVAAGTTVTLRSPGLDGFYGGVDDQTWTTTTDAAGNYYFRTLSSADNRKPASWSGVGNLILPGYSYRIEVAVPVGYQITKANAALNGFDNIDNDAAQSGTNAVVLFTTGNTDHNFDIGFKPLASLGDKVWMDDNKDGVQQAAEPGVSGITVTLKNNVGTVVATTITDALGNYLFDNLTAGDYTVTVTLPANYTFTTQSNTTDDNNTTGASTTGSDVNVTTGQSYTVTLSAGENNRNVDAGIIFNVPAASNSLGDKVWYDVNANGVQDGTEPGVAGVTVILYASNGTTVIATTITDANGNYIFNNLPASTDYIVGVTPPAGMVFTTTSGTTSGNATTNSDVNATLGSATYGKTTVVNTGVAGTQITGIDAGIIPQAATTASLGDRVWNDLNSNGTQDAGEPGIAGVTVNLYEDVNGDNVISGAELVAVRTTTTDPFGYYTFNNLVVTGSNKWQVEFVQPVGYTNTPVANNNSGNDATDSDITNNATDRTDLIRLFYNERNTKTDAGFVQTAPAGALKLGDKVWRDDNGDGQQLATEPGVAGVAVKLYQNGTDGLPGTADDVLVNSTVTDINGDYLFVNLAASSTAATNYNVQFSNLPAGFSFTAADAGADATDNDANTVGKTGSYNLLADNLTVDAGIVIGVPIGMGSLGDRVWYDLSNIGIQDAGELGAAGVTVNLYLDANGDGQITGGEQTAVKTTTTNALGEYMFDGLNAGTYQVGFALPAALSTYTLSAKDAGTSDALDSDGNPKNTSVLGNVAGAQTSYTGVITLAQGEDKLTVDLGIVPPAATNTLGGTAWFDTDSDGTQTANPGRVPGVVVNLYNNAGTLIATTTTDENGDYLFVGLADGNYSVAFAAYPAGFDITTRSATNDATGSDADIVNGRTPTVTLNAGNRNDRTLDAGLISTRAALGNKVWEDLDGDGIQDAGEPGIAGVTVTLWQDITTQVASTVTDENGYYFFPNLIANFWQVGYTTTPAGLVFTVKDNTAGPDADGANSWTGGGDSDVNPSGVYADKTDIFALAASEVNLTVDAGLRRTPIATVGNRVWDDINVNGIQDPTEPGIPGVIATLYNSANQPIGSAVTDGNGIWLITNVPVGTGYYVIFTNQPLGDFTIQDVGGAGTGGGTDSDTDSDVNTAGQTGTFDVTANTVNIKIDAGIIQSKTLPVRLVSFTAKPQGEKVALQWNVAEQVNISSYTLEYSTNGVSFNTLETVAANTSANAVYNTVHNAPVKGINYYRLKINEPAGRYSYSDIRTVKFTDAGTVTVSPNPFMEKIDISISIVSAQDVVISMIDAKGRVVKQSRAALAKGTNLVPVYNLQALAPGVYIVSVQSVNGTTAFTHKLVKE